MFLGILIPIGTIYVASLWFNYRMYVFSKFVHEKIEPEVKSQWTIRHPCSNILAFIVATILFIFNIW